MKRLIVLFLLVFALANLYAVTLYTPNGESFNTWDEGRPSYDAAWFEAYKTNNFGPGKPYPNSEVLGEWENGLWEYNCHVFAWNNWQGAERWNSESDMWALGKPSPYDLLWRYYPDVWYTDYDNPIGIVSYIETSNQNEASIITYKSGSDITHSARIIGSGTRYISKWGSNPIIKHPPTEVPSIYGSTYKYYKINDAYRPIGEGDPAGRNWQTISNALNGIPSGGLIAVLSGTQTLTGNISIPSGITLKIHSGITVNLNGFYIKSTGGSFVEESNITWLPENVKILQGSSIKGYYSSIQLALGNATSGQTVVVASGTHSLNANATVASGVTLQMNAGATINFTGSYKLLMYGTLVVSGSSGQHVIIDGQGYSRYGYGNAMILVSQTGSASIQYADFKNAAYELTLSFTSGNIALSNCTFTNFGYTTDSKAVSAYYSTGPVTITNNTFTGAGQNGMGIYASNTGTNVVISNNIFSTCRYGIRCYSSNALITGNTIQNCSYYGIYSDNVTLEADYRDNTINGHPSTYGIYLNNSYPYLTYNTITSNKVLINSGYPYFATRPSEDPTQRGYNTISEANPELIRVQNYSTPYLGYGVGGGYNSIFETDIFHIYATNHCGVYADNNYWGGGSPVNEADETSWILDRWPLSENPNLGKNLAITDSLILADISQDEKEDEAEFLAALDAGFNSDYVKSKELLTNLIYKETSSKFPILSILMYDHFTKRELQDEKSNRDENTVKGELDALIADLCSKEEDDPLRPFGLKLNARESVVNNDYASFSGLNNQIIQEYPNSIHELTSLFDEISYQVEVKGDLEKAKELLSRMDKAYPDDELTLMAHVLIGENIDLTAPKAPKQAENTMEEEIPIELRLYQAFPNPFNASTTISFDLPNNSHVRIVVYDALGREVAELLNNTIEKGRHSVVLDGVNLASGIYLIKFKADNTIRILKVTLMK